MEQWTVKRILDWIRGYLAEHGDPNPLLSAQWLVSDALNMSRIQLYADYNRPLTPEERGVLRDYTKRRAAGEPLQYITGTTDFRFITVHVEPGVLIPRPETEVLVSEALSEVRKVRSEKKEQEAAAEAQKSPSQDDRDAAEREGSESDTAADFDGRAEGARLASAGAEANVLAEDEAPAEEPWRVADLCTGTGCIACSIATEVPASRVVATDIEPKAVQLAQKNARDLGVDDRVDVVECDLAAGVDDSWNRTADLVISNPPYVPTDVMSSLDKQVADFEPARALDGGPDGLDLYRRILPEATRLLRSGGVLAVELHETCLDQAAELAREAGFAQVRIAKDLAARDRVLVARAR